MHSRTASTARRFRLVLESTAGQSIGQGTPRSRALLRAATRWSHLAGQRCGRQLLVHCYRMVGSLEEGEDLVQQNAAQTATRLDRRRATNERPDRQTVGGVVLWHFTMSLDGFVAGPNHEMDWMTGFASRAGPIEESKWR